MAIEWYRIDAGLKTHPKRTRVAKVTGCNKLEALAYITLLFTFTATHAEDGGIEKFSPSEIEDACEWAGVEGLLYKAFVEAGFIDVFEQGKIVHDWYEKNWKHVENERRKKKAYRESQKNFKENGGQRPDGDHPGTGQAGLRPVNERTNERTNEPILIYTVDRDRIKWAKQRFISMREGLAHYKGKAGYTWSELDRTAANRVLYPDFENGGSYPAQEDLELGLKNFFASDPKWTADHSAFWFFQRFNQFVAGPAVDRKGPVVGRGDAKDRGKHGLSGFGAQKKIEGKGKGVAHIDWTTPGPDAEQPGGGEAASPEAGGSHAKV